MSGNRISEDAESEHKGGNTMKRSTKMISLAISMILVSSFAFALSGGFGTDEKGQGGRGGAGGLLDIEHN